ncbi:MAG: arsenate reductase ArsC [Candidatus Brocadiaceae bacterium]|jgi:arsenate reductase
MPTPERKLKGLFLCTGNSCRRQMAEGWARHLRGNEIEPYSAGVEPHGLDPRAVRVMAEAGIDISCHGSKHVSDLVDMGFDYVVTVCNAAPKACPVFPGKVRMMHKSFEDPPWLTAAASPTSLSAFH